MAANSLLPKQPTMRDVAQLAGVSSTTVSHVFNNTRHVEETTREKVWEAAKKLRYQPSMVARSLTTKRTNTIGVIVADLSDAFFGQVMESVGETLCRVDYGIIVCDTKQEPGKEELYLNLLIRQCVDGIIAMSTSQKWEALTIADDLGIPLVFVDRTFSDFDRPFVGVDNFHGAYMGAMHLIESGWRDIGILVGLQHLSTMRDRLAGFKQAMVDSNIDLPQDWIQVCPLSVEGARQSAIRLLSPERRPKALLLCNNLLGLGTLLAIRELNLNCPSDIALVGFDDLPWATVSEPPLTVIRQPAPQIGHKAATLILDLLSEQALEQQSYIFDCELVLRQSC